MNNKLLVIFVDGLGIGKKNPNINPLFSKKYKLFEDYLKFIPSIRNNKLIASEYSIFPIDARMGVKGLPQSGTGQTSIFCGVNAQKIINQHFGPYPYSTLKPILKEKNIFFELKQKNKTVQFLNAYPKQFFEYVKSGKKSLSVTTLSCKYSGIKLNNFNDLRTKKAISAEIINDYWINKFNYKLKIEEPYEVGKMIINHIEKYDFSFFEYFLTDHAGHSQSFEFAEKTLTILFDFILGVIENINLKEFNVLIISDHGNIEDLYTKSHTLNPALGISIGNKHKLFNSKIKSLKEIKETILNYFEIN